MTKTTKKKILNQKNLKLVTDVTLSITKQVLLFFFEFGKDYLEMMIDPYGKFNETMYSKPRFKHYKRYDKQQIYSAVQNLKRQKLIKSYEQDGRTLYKLNEEGELEARKQLIKQGLETKKMDGKWRVVIFDIPEKKHKLRDNFRNLLKELDFRMLQASVWASPFDIFDELEMLIPNIKRHSWIKLLLVEVIVGERNFKKLFKRERNFKKLFKPRKNYKK